MKRNENKLMLKEKKNSAKVSFMYRNMHKMSKKDTVLMKSENAKQTINGFIDTVPLGISTSIYGLVYGVMAANAGLNIFETIAMSVFVFAGASQMTAVQMIAIGSGALSIILTVFIINLRHFLMAASLAPYLKNESVTKKMITSFFMTDESYAVTYSQFQKEPPTSSYFLGSGLNIYLFWGSSGAVGYFFGNLISAQMSYVFDFAFVAAFIGMIVPMVKTKPAVVTVLVSAVISIVGSLYIPGKWYIIIAGLFASFAGFLASELIEKKKQKEKGVITYEY